MQNGFVLLIVLIFLNVFSILGLSAFNSSIIHFKSNAMLWDREKLLFQAKAKLHHIENIIVQHAPSCVIPIHSALQLTKQSATWWKAHACKMQDYYYVTEFLGDNPCVIPNQNQESLGAQYYRITLIDLSAQANFNKIILQSVIAIKNPESLTCSEKPYKINLGEQMFREL